VLDRTGREEKHPAAVQVMKDSRLTPLTLFPGRNRPWPCQCDDCQAEVTPRLSGILAGQGGCVFCGKRRGANKRRIPDSRARVHMQAAGFDPYEPYSGFGHPWPSTCRTCHETSSPTLADVLDGHGCRVCNAGYVDPEKARQVFLDKGFTPLDDEPFTGVKQPWPSTHTCGAVVRPTLQRLRTVISGVLACTHCTPGGWDSNAPSRVYVIERPDLLAH
jgi:hypothetical protein